MKLAIIGAGNVGKALGTALRAKDHTVVYGTRDPAKSTERNAKTVAEALRGSEAVILATPGARRRLSSANMPGSSPARS